MTAVFFTAVVEKSTSSEGAAYFLSQHVLQQGGGVACHFVDRWSSTARGAGGAADGSADGHVEARPALPTLPSFSRHTTPTAAATRRMPPTYTCIGRWILYVCPICTTFFVLSDQPRAGGRPLAVYCENQGTAGHLSFEGRSAAALHRVRHREISVVRGGRNQPYLPRAAAGGNCVRVVFFKLPPRSYCFQNRLNHNYCC